MGMSLALHPAPLLQESLVREPPTSLSPSVVFSLHSLALEQGRPCPSLSFQDELWLSLRCAPAFLSQVIWEKGGTFLFAVCLPLSRPFTKTEVPDCLL